MRNVALTEHQHERVKACQTPPLSVAQTPASGFYRPPTIILPFRETPQQQQQQWQPQKGTVSNKTRPSS